MGLRWLVISIQLGSQWKIIGKQKNLSFKIGFAVSFRESTGIEPV